MLSDVQNNPEQKFFRYPAISVTFFEKQEKGLKMLYIMTLGEGKDIN